MITSKYSNHFSRSAAGVTVSLLALFAPGLSYAQTTANAQPEEIVVTAQRRSQKIQEVPVAISTMTPAQLERSGVTNVRDLSTMVPGIRMSGAGANVIPAIRGVQADPSDPGNDANVSMYIDGIYLPNQIGNAADLPDISRVEVLKGPQGTLYGRNATGGAIRIFTIEPQMNKYGGSLDVGYGNYNDFTLKGYLTGPIVEDRLAFLVSGSYENRDGFSRNLATGARTEGLDGKTARIKLKFTPTDNLSFEIFGSYARRSDGDATAYTALGGNALGRLFPGAIIATQPHTFTATAPTTLKVQTRTLAGRLTWDTDIGTLESTTAVYAARGYYYTESDLTNADVLSYPEYVDDHNFQQEVIFTSKKFDQFQVTAGFNYYQATGRYDPLIFSGIGIGGTAPASIITYMRQGTDAYAGFGEVTWDATDRLTLLAGIRYSHETKDAQGCYCYFTYDPNFVYTRPSTIPQLGKKGVGSATPRASIRYRLTDEDDNVYFTYSQGFKSGGFNYAALQTTPFKPEKLTAYEIGLKTSPSRMISANISAFYYDYKDKQTQAQVNGTNITNNAASSRIYGADADIIAHLAPDFTVTAGVAWLDSKYKSYPNAPANTPTLNPDGTPCLCGNDTIILDLSGMQASNAPKFSGSLTATYTPQISAGDLDLSATLYYTSKFNFQASPRIFTGSYATLALRAAFTPTDSNFTFYAWGKNITDTTYVQNFFISNGGDGANYAPPATYGAGIKYTF
jgi:iron complex outermembrane receptor protein